MQVPTILNILDFIDCRLLTECIVQNKGYVYITFSPNFSISKVYFPECIFPECILQNVLGLYFCSRWEHEDSPVGLFPGKYEWETPGQCRW